MFGEKGRDRCSPKGQGSDAASGEQTIKMKDGFARRRELAVGKMVRERPNRSRILICVLGGTGTTLPGVSRTKQQRTSQLARRGGQSHCSSSATPVSGKFAQSLQAYLIHLMQDTLSIPKSSTLSAAGYGVARNHPSVPRFPTWRLEIPAVPESSVGKRHG